MAITARPSIHGHRRRPRPRRVPVVRPVVPRPVPQEPAAAAPRHRWISTTVAAASTVVLFVLLGVGAPEPVAVSPATAVESWVTAERAAAFPGATGPYVGACEGATAPGLCSSLQEDLGDHQIHTVGAVASDWGGDLLLERDGSDWVVAAYEPWPELGATDAFGPPWSPSTAIAEWWQPRADRWFGAGTVHLRHCAEAAEVATQVDQPILCSTLVEEVDGRRTYDSGLYGQPPATRLVLGERADHTWAVLSFG